MERLDEHARGMIVAIDPTKQTQKSQLLLFWNCENSRLITLKVQKIVVVKSITDRRLYTFLTKFFLAPHVSDSS